MIIASLPAQALPARTYTRRLREERVGGQAFDPLTGQVVELTETELRAVREQSLQDDSLCYFATRSWGALAEGCLSTPNRIYLEVTNRCNLSCAMCYRDAGAASGEPELTTDEMTHLIRALASLGVHELRVTGGEPTVRPDLCQLIDEAIACGLYVSLGTNGVWPGGMTESLLARPLGRYLVSLDGPEPLNDSLRGAGSFRRTVATLARLIAAERNVRVNTVITARLLDTLPEFARFLADLGLRHLSLIAPRPVGRGGTATFAADRPGPTEIALAARLIPDVERDSGLKIEFQYRLDGATAGQASDPVIRKVRCCPAGREAAFISPTGWLHACGCSPGGSADPDERAPYAAGNVRGQNPAAIWKLWQEAEVWRSFRDLQLSKHQACFTCAHYGNGCFGSCPVHAFAATGRFDAADPLCPMLAEQPLEV